MLESLLENRVVFRFWHDYRRNVATINSLEEFLDSIHTQLDELWRLPQNYPQNRMIDLMDIICEF